MQYLIVEKLQEKANRMIELGGPKLADVVIEKSKMMNVFCVHMRNSLLRRDIPKSLIMSIVNGAAQAIAELDNDEIQRHLTNLNIHYPACD